MSREVIGRFVIVALVAMVAVLPVFGFSCDSPVLEEFDPLEMVVVGGAFEKDVTIFSAGVRVLLVLDAKEHLLMCGSSMEIETSITNDEIFNNVSEITSYNGNIVGRQITANRDRRFAVFPGST